MSSTCFYFIFYYAFPDPLFDTAARSIVIYVKRYSRNLVFKRPFFIFKPYLKNKKIKKKNTRAAYSCSHVFRTRIYSFAFRILAANTATPCLVLHTPPPPPFFLFLIFLFPPTLFLSLRHSFLIYVPDICTGIPYYGTSEPINSFCAHRRFFHVPHSLSRPAVTSYCPLRALSVFCRVYTVQSCSSSTSISTSSSTVILISEPEKCARLSRPLHPARLRRTHVGGRG